jgi:hypothetical protein
MEREAAAPSCRLDRAALDDQLERYRQISGHVEAVEREPGRLVVRFAPDLPRDRLEVALEVERGCCPFLGIDYDAGGRRLVVAVEQVAQDPMLDALAHALSPQIAG